MKTIRFTFLLLTAFVLVSCGGGGGGGGSGSSAITSLYVLDYYSAQVDAYDSPATETGTMAPDRTITGASTQLTGNIYGAAYDSRTDSLFVSSYIGSRIMIYDKVSTLSGNAPPSRVISGASTGLSTPDGLMVDTQRDLLYVVDTGKLLVFSGAKTINGNATPTHTITGSNTNFGSGTPASELALDEANDRLYVTVASASAVDVYDNASTVDGNTAPTRIISGSSTTFAFPWGIALDSTRDLLYVADQGTASVDVFSNASTVGGNTAPTRVITGAATTLAAPVSAYVDPATDTLYVTDNTTNVVMAWSNASTASGNTAPARTINSGSSGLGAVVGAT